jgi:O-antigen ligase
MIASPRWVGAILPHWVGSVLLLIVTAGPIGKGGTGAHMFIKESLAETWIVVSACVYLLLVRGKSLRFSLDPLVVVLLLYVVCGGVSLLWSSNAGYGFVVFMRWTAALLLAAMAYQVRDRSDINTIIRYIFVAGVFVAVIGCLQHLFGFDLYPQAKRPASTFANRNMAAQVAIIAWLSGPWLLWQLTERNSIAQYACAIGTAIMLTFVFYTQTRAAWISIGAQILLVVCCLLVVRARDSKLLVAKNIGLLPVMAGALFLIVLCNFSSKGFTPVWSTVSDRLGTIVADASQTEGAATYDRFVIWRSTLEIVEDHPILGAGLGSFDHLHQRYAVGDTLTIHYSHNDYLQSLAETGAIGALMVLMTLALLIYRGVRLVFVDELSAQGLMALAVLISLGGIVVDAVFSFPLQLVAPTMLASVLIAVLLKLTARERELDFDGVSQVVVLGALAPVATVILLLNMEFSLKLDELSAKTKAGSWSEPIDLDTSVHHPIFRRFIRVIAQRYQLDDPTRAEMAARSYYAIDSEDVVVNNTLAVSLIYQKRYQEAEALIEATRPLEPRGYYRSFENELILGTQTRDFERLRRVLDELEQEPKELLLAERKTYINMATTAFNLGESEKALALLEELSATYPNYSKAEQLREEIQRRMGAR